MAYLESERLAREERQDVHRCRVAAACPACRTRVRVPLIHAVQATIQVRCGRCGARFKVDVYSVA